jgi:phosphate transport system substrate-binding protein
MAYFGFSYFNENRSRLNAIQIRNPKTNQCITPSTATVHAETYKPLGRPLFIYVKGTSFKKRHVQAFIDYIFDNEVRIANRADFIPLTKKQLKRARTSFHLQLAQAKRT